MFDESNDKKVKWLRDPTQKGKFLFTYDEKQIFNLFRDYPHALTDEQKRIFDEEEPYWAKFFSDRK